jgi:predicted nucleotidyltransferase
MDKNKIIEILKEHKLEIQEKGANSIALFGSYSKDLQNEQSDIDLLIEFSQGKKNFDNFMEINFLLEDIFSKKVELITTESISPDFKEEITKHLIYAY